MLPAPHGGTLKERMASEKEKEEILKENLPEIEVERDLAWEVENISVGLFSPLEGFMKKEELKSVLDTMRLPDGTPWTIPIVFPLKENPGERVIIKYRGKPLALFEIEEIFTYDPKEIAEKTYGTDSTEHPGVVHTLSMGDRFAGGKLTLLSKISHPFEKFTLTPKETRVLFEEKGWRTVVAFQTRNVPHLGHEYVQKSALTFTDGLFINPVIGKKKRGDFRDEVILDAYQALIQHYYPPDRVVMSIWNTRMRYAGPREAIFHAIVRKNFGCTHIIIGRDHAGVGNFYHPYAAQEIFDEFPDLGIIPFFFRSFFYCRRCGTVVNEKICPHSEEDRVNFSGTKIRKMLLSGEDPSPLYMRPEVVQVIRGYENPFVEE